MALTGWLKQSTTATLKLGPFVDATDGVTAETGLTLSQADVRLSKNGGDFAQKTEATAATHDELGYYDCPIDATDTATLGRLSVVVSESGALPVRHDYLVLPANTYDSLVGGSDFLQVDAHQIEGADATTTIDGRLTAIGLDHLVSASVAGADVTDNSIIAKLVSSSATADWDDFVNTTDSLQGIRDNCASQPAIHSGTLQTGSSTSTVILANAAEALIDDYYIGCNIYFLTGTGAPQERQIVGYVSGTRAASLDRDLNEAVDDTTTYDVRGYTPEARLADGIITSGTLDATALTAIFNKVWTTALTEAYAADLAAPTPAQAVLLIQQMLTAMGISGTTVTVKKIDKATTAATFTLSDADEPTSIARAS